MQSWLRCRASVLAASHRLVVKPFNPATTRTYKSATPEEEFDRARRWYDALSSTPMPKDVGELSYSRSSGPGGQNVNK